ncbi:hypothetical protein WR25_12550 isoform G [Diploscapter pachys]|uniref:Coatomer subunit epsilon n=1 Tax=Diploscapter pachys TaxID=2018661 RepID=A0A2A2JRD2_9BILA|nr:hypothetical protein WR25_12550 isoform G [Diploscapter pachys]
MSVDRLFDVKNAFYLGNYQQCINEAQKFSAKNDEERLWRDVYMYRSYIAQGKASIPLSEISDKTSLAHKALRRFANFQNPQQRYFFFIKRYQYVPAMSTKNFNLLTRILKLTIKFETFEEKYSRHRVAQEVQAEVTEGKLANDETAIILAATILNQSGNPEDALRALFKSTSLESSAAKVQTLLKMDRVDLAVKALKKMMEVDEDATLTQLALAWVNMSLGKDKLKDAFYIYQEMMDKYGQTPMLLVGQSSALILQEKYEEAEKLLQEAQLRDANNPESLINLVVISDYLGKDAEVFFLYILPSHPR